MSGIYWLASYPKSGNTWVRCFISAMLGQAGARDDLINHLEGSLGSASRELFDRIAGSPAADLDETEIALLRPRVYARLAESSPTPLYLKIHDQPRMLAGTERGHAIVPVSATLGVLLIVRNPLDVAVSYARQNGEAVDQVIDWMADAQHGLCLETDRLPVQLPQRLGDWSSHTQAWLEDGPMPPRLVRYEDLLRAGEPMFAAIAAHLGLTRDETALRDALAACRFERLKDQEARFGFRECLPGRADFFRAGRVGGWRDVLDERQVARIVERHGEMMRRLGYLTAAGAISELCR